MRTTDAKENHTTMNTVEQQEQYDGALAYVQRLTDVEIAETLEAMVHLQVNATTVSAIAQVIIDRIDDFKASLIDRMQTDALEGYFTASLQAILNDRAAELFTCEDCGRDTRHGTHGVQVDVDWFECYPAYDEQNAPQDQKHADDLAHTVNRMSKHRLLSCLLETRS